MKKYLLLSFLIVFISSVFAQEGEKIKISQKKVGEGLFDFYAENPNHFPMQMELYFTEFENMKANCELPYVSTVQPGKHLIFNVRRTIVELPGAFQYKYNTRVGAFPVIPNVEYKYKLPVLKGKKTKVISFDYSKSATPEKIIWGFGMEAGDTIKAAREGVVCMKTETKIIDSLRVGNNSVVLLHPDNTFGRYELFNDNSIFVNLGDSVNVGDALGIVESGEYSPVSHVRFSVYYTNARIDSINLNKLRNIHTYLNPIFIDQKGKSFLLEGDKLYN